MWRLALVAVLVTGCMGAETVECPGGGVCPAGLACRLDQGAHVCVAESCGNGVVEAGERCDDGNNDSGDTCPGDCVTQPSCGDGNVDPGEDCDDGNRTSGDGCQAMCRFPIRPPARSDAAIAYDPSRGVLVMFGGRDSEQLLGDTWEWNGIEWTQIDTLDPVVPRPAPRAGAALTFDPLRQRVVMFGGNQGGPTTPLGDFWEWDGTTWRRIVSDTSPARCARPTMAFDTTRNVIVLFGGELQGSFFELSEWNGTDWTPMFMMSGPSPQQHPAMAFDASRGQTVVIGSAVQSGMWFWDGVRWWELPIPSPNRFVAGNMAYDAARSRLVYFGGFSEGATPEFGGTWEYDGDEWIDHRDATGPGPRSGAAMAYVDSIHEVVVFGGARDGVGGSSSLLNDLWSWDGAAWRERL